ncbi:glycosyltransferase [Candidatus Fermentibacteria bacterium]|nr:glycosyltransferase [Candidatus Fermentibacteria bacterium]
MVDTPVKSLFGWEGRYRSVLQAIPARSRLREGVTVIIPSWNAVELLAACLRCVEAQDLSPTRILVVDNASTDGTRELVSRSRKVEVVRLPRNVGYSGALSLAFPLVDTSFVAILNNDARPDREWLLRLVGHLREYPHLGCAYPLAIRTDGTIDTAGDVLTIAGFAYKRLHRRGRLVRPRDGLFVSPPGVAPVYRTVAVASAGGWDGMLHSQWDDVDLGIRLWNAGWDAVLDTKVRVVHEQGSSSSRRARSREFLAARNEAVVLLKTMSPFLLVLMAPHHALFLILSFCSHLFRGTAPAFLAGKAAALASLGAIAESRGRLHPVRWVHIRSLDWRWLSVWYGLSRFGGRRAPTAS